MAWSDGKKEYYRMNPMAREVENEKQRERHRRRSPLPLIKCKGCGVEFQRTRHDQAFHSPECKRAYHNRRLAEQEKAQTEKARQQEQKAKGFIKCAGCDEMFRPDRRGQTYHSADCRLNAHRVEQDLHEQAEREAAARAGQVTAPSKREYVGPLAKHLRSRPWV